ncbi:unnamed protein product, partial [Owenia fusiformis]
PTSNCTPDGWEDPTQICAPNCPDPGLIPNGKVSSSGGPFRVGDDVSFVCDDCYEFESGTSDGQVTITCNADGTWTGVVPVCKVKSCGPLLIENGIVSGGTNCGETVTYSCNENFYLSGPGSPTSRCTPDGWEDPTQLCSPNCPDPGVISNGDTISSGGPFIVEDDVSYTCDPCYEFKNGTSLQVTLTCKADGTWTAATPVCTIKTCERLVVNNGALIGGNNCGDNASYSCDSLYELSGFGPIVIQCTEDGWEQSDRICILSDVDCVNPGDVANGRVIGEVQETFTRGNSLTYTCDTCYEFEGGTSEDQMTIICRADGTWTGARPVCKVKTCEDIDPPQDGLFASDVDNRCGSAINVTCKSDCFDLIGEEQITCSEDGWSESPTCQARTCSEIPPFENGIINDGGNISRTCGSALLFVCSEGYMIEGESSLTCSGLGWSNPFPSCKQIPCQAFTTPEKSEVLSGEKIDGIYFPGDVIEVRCDDCHAAGGQVIQSLTCQTGGVWDIEPIPCELLVCDAPPTIENGRFRPKNFECGSTITYECDKCRMLQGRENATCVQEGAMAIWDHNTQQCILNVCPTVLVPAGGGIEDGTADGNVCGDSVSFFCEEDKNLIGAQKITCEVDGTWNKQEPECRVGECPVEVQLENGEIISGLRDPTDTYVTGDVLEYACDNCYGIDGSNLVECGLDGRWSALPTCTLHICGPQPSAPEHGFIDTDETVCGTTLTYSCEECYELIGSPTRTCGNDGQWSPINPPTCQLKTCSEPPFRPDTVVTGSARTCGSTVTYSCVNPPCYIFSGSESKTCMPTKRWSPFSGPTCTVKTCQRIRVDSPGQLTLSDSFNCGSVAAFGCVDCWQLVGPRNITCSEEGSWGTNFPSCQTVVCADPIRPQNGRVTYFGTDCGDRAVYTCDRCYRLVGKPIIICQSDGLYNHGGTFPTCVFDRSTC